MSGRGWLPGVDSELLLRAALATRDEAAAAWHAWLARHDLDVEHLPFESFRLLPAVYVNLAPHAPELPLLGTLKGIHRSSWVNNQHTFRRALPVLELLDRAGVEAALLKGAALVRWAYPDAGTRPMHDVDILVRAEQGPRALRALHAEGWKGRRLATAGERRLRLVASMSIHHPEREAAFDLHFRPIAEAFGDDAPFWTATIETEFQGRRTRLLSRTHELALVLAHGSRMHPEPMPQWVTDAVYAVRAGGIDWDELGGLAERARLSLRFAHSLAYVERTFAAGVPAAVLDRLAAVDAPRFEREELDTLLELDGRFDAHALHRLYYRRASEGRSWPARAAGYPLYVRDVEGVRLLDVPGRLRKWSRWTRRVERRRQGLARGEA